MRAAFTFNLVSPTSADKAWSLVGDLAGVTKWVPGMTACTVDSDIRSCTFADGRTVVERITDFDDAARSYDYRTDTDGTPMAVNGGSLAVAETADGGSRVTWLAEVEFVSNEAADQMLPMLRTGYGAAFDQLADQLQR
jgi:Polyketide cyclase / dehydrase and lipid transport